ncbi:MAG: flagellar basal body L-ring protein FlgH [Oceanipulchritudo sp.]
MLAFAAGLVLSLAPAEESNGSLWNKKTVRGGMYADKIARGVGDILTIVVQEASEISSSKNSSVNKESSISTQIQRLLDNSDEDYPGLAWEVAREFEGGGQLSDSQSAESRLSVVVIDRLPNGNLVVEGMRQMVMANEVNYAVLRGYVRPADIRADNSILSSSIADARIEFVADGALSEAQREGWLSRLYSFLSPF